MIRQKILITALLIVCGFLFNVSLVTAQKKKLTYKQAFNFGEPRFTSQVPQLKGWLDDDYYLEVKSDPSVPGSKPSLMKVKAIDGSSEIFIDYGKINEVLPEGFTIQSATPDENYNGFLFNQKNDLYYYSHTEEVFKRLTKDDDEEKNPQFSPDGKKVAYTKNYNLYVYDIEAEEEKQLTKDGGGLIYNGWASWVYMEEILGRATNYTAFWWSPNSEMISFLRFDDNPVPEFPIYRADGQHGELELQRYPKAGDPNPFVKLGVVDIKSAEIVWADFDEKADHYIAFPFWTNDNKLTVQWMNREQDNIIIYLVDTKTGKKKELHSEKQSTWVEWFEDLRLMKNGKGFILITGIDGWYGLYLYDMNSKLKTKITEENLTVINIASVDEKNDKIYFHGWKGNSTERHLFAVNMNGKNLKQLTTIAGTHTCEVSPGGKYFYDRYSNRSLPTKIDLCKTDGSLIRNLADTKLSTMYEYDLAKSEFFTIPSGDGYNLPAVWSLPPEFDKNKKYPVIISIYGGPNSPSVRNSFPFMLEGFYLAQSGIIYMSVDHRGSGHFGKKGIDLMHRNLGKWEMYDYSAAAKWLKQQAFIDTTKIAIEGGSYGGYVTALALTYGADYFTHGIAEFGVMDWLLYDNVYTERYMDTPKENPDGYKNSSVLSYVYKYKGKMLITHGTMDDNVHMQNSIQLVYELQKQNKDFEMMFYPNARHGVHMPLYFHYVKEKAKFWFKYLLGKELNVDED